MDARPRRAASVASNSTVATVDLDAIQYYKEDTILKPASSRLTPDEWPCFLLNDATVYYPDGRLANLLDVDLEGPFIIRGRLEIESDQARYLVNRHTRTEAPWIQIESSSSFSVGASQDLIALVIWASGKAGWFEIKPSDQYKSICNIMHQGVAMHYAILDQYEEALLALQQQKKKNKLKTLAQVKLPLEQILLGYVVRVGDVGVFLSEVHHRLEQQAVFFLSHFPRDTEFYNYMAGRFPDTYQRLLDKKDRDPKQIVGEPVSCVLEAVNYPIREKSSSMEIHGNKKRGRPAANGSVTRSNRISEPTHGENVDFPRVTPETQASRSFKGKGKSPLESRDEQQDTAMTDASLEDQSYPTTLPNHARKRNGLRAPPPPAPAEIHQPLGETSGSANISAEFVSTGNPLVDALHIIRNKVLNEHISSGGTKKKHPDTMTPKNWQVQLYLECNIKPYEALNEVCLYNAREFVRLLGPEWHSTPLYRWAKENEDTMPDYNVISEENIRKVRLRQRNPAISSRVAEPTPSTKVDLQPETPEPRGKHPKRGRPPGSKSALRLSTGSKKRLRHDTEFEDDMDIDDNGALTKSYKKSRLFSDGENNDETNEELSSEDENQPEDKESLTRLVIRAERIPSAAPQGPNQTWTCEEPDCDYVVRGADEEEGQLLINVHYEEHEQEAREVAEEEAQNRAQLAIQEGTKGHMPVNHLLEKIRSLGEKSQNRHDHEEDVNGKPEPIKRALFV
ncbi:hypothetical protein F5Y15DRAFT_332727 [Xylariaceae sp. FL0016]|nr:hypothetical protein F5Y15DRAFT_332727 [Xylariaceae sp. FL0016]